MAVNNKPKFRNWQKYLDDTVIVLKKEGNYAKFEHMKSSSDRIKLIERVTSLKPAWIDEYFKMCGEWHTSKCDKEAEFYRIAGNKYFQEKDYTQALNSYNQCVKHATFPSITDSVSDQLSIGYANRSAVLLRLGHLQSCLDDIQLALENHYPPHLAYKLYHRQALCLRKCGQIKEAFVAIEKAKTALADANISQDKKDEKLVDLVKLTTDHENEAPSSSSDRITAEVHLPTPIHGHNDISLAWNEVQGRHIVSKNAIQAGRVLFMEKPYAAILLPSHYVTHCHHCYTKLLNTIPCQHCTDVGYCSKKCQSDSWAIYHRIECRYLDLLHSIGVAHLSLRIILTAGLDHLSEFQATYKPSDPRGLTSDGKDNRNYLAVYELMPHIEDMPTEDLIQYAMTAELLLQLLSECGFFEGNSNNAMSRSTDQKYYVGGLLLRHICQLVCNAHAITGLRVAVDEGSSPVHSQSQERIASAIYPTASLMNHACDPTVIASFQQDVLVVRTIKDVKPNEEIFNCYGPHYCKMSYRERQQQLLEQYFFSCRCTACLKQEISEQKLQAFNCPKCKGPLIRDKTLSGKCLHCKHVNDTAKEVVIFEKSRDLFRQGLLTLETGNIEAAIIHLLECQSIRKRVLYKYNRDLAEIHDVLAKCYAIKGDYKRSCTYLAPSISATQEIYGSRSIELANELHKYAEVLVNASNFKKALSVAEQAQDIFQLNYGENHEIVLEIKDLIKNIQSADMEEKQ